LFFFAAFSDGYIDALVRSPAASNGSRAGGAASITPMFIVLLLPAKATSAYHQPRSGVGQAGTYGGVLNHFHSGAAHSYSLASRRRTGG